MSKTHDKISEIESQKRDTLKLEKPYVYEKIMQYEDKFNRGESIAIIQLQYDYRCNLSCDHCCTTAFTKKERTLTVDDVKEIARQADEMGLAQIVITGGEPLVFPDLEKIIQAIDPQKFQVVMDTNGWFLDLEKAQRLKLLGVDKIQLSLDSIDPDEHDTFRRKMGSHKKAMRALDASLEAGLNTIIATVVTKQRVRSQEFIDFLEFGKKRGVGIFVTFAKPVGSWAGNYDIMADNSDHLYIRELEKKYDVFTHMTPSYGMNIGCIAVKRMFSITKYGDVMPCPYIHVALGNIFEEPLNEIVNRGLKIKYFREFIDSCPIALDKEFNEKYIAKAYDKPLPAPYREIFTSGDDYVDGKLH